MAEARETEGDREREQRQLAASHKRVRQARDRELLAHERAAELHEEAAQLQERLSHQDRAEHARRYAALARERIQLAHAEQAVWEATLASLGSPSVATTPPHPGEPAA